MLRVCIGLITALFIVVMPARAQACGDQFGQFISNGLAAYVDQKRPVIEEQLRLELGKGNLFADGITLYNINTRMGAADFQYAGNEVLYTIRGNHLYFKSTTPTFLGSYADPAFQVRFDIELRGPIVAPLDRAPYAEWLAGRVASITVDSRNVTGGVVTTIINVFALTGPGAAAIQKAVDTYLVRDMTGLLNEYLEDRTDGLAFMSSTKSGSTTSFHNPMYDCGGAPAAVDVCKSWGAECGEPAAQEFCRRQGFKHVIEYTTTSGRQPTWVPVSQRLCIGPSCGSFATIACANSPKLNASSAVKSRSSTITGSMPVDPSTIGTRQGSSISGALGGVDRTAASAATAPSVVGSTAAGSAPDMTCLSGYVWRAANASDLVCVTPESRSLSASETASAASRADPNGAWGPATCLPGYVWREAFEGDTVCVTPDRRAAVKSENASAASRRVPAK